MKTIKDYQKQVSRVVKDKGFDNETVHQVLGLLVEEVGELAKSLRKSTGIKTGQHSKDHSPQDEAADVFFMLLDFCERLGIDLETAFEAKLKKIRKREAK